MLIRGKLLWMILAFFCFSCQNDPLSSDQASLDYNSPSIVMVDNPIADSIIYDPATIDKTWIRGDMMQMVIQYRGGCQVHDFSLYGSSLFMKSNPPQANIYLSHRAYDDVCPDIFRKNLIFHLTPLLDSCRKQFGTGQILLRIYEPDSNTPISPFIPAAF